MEINLKKDELANAWKGGKWKWAKRKVLARDDSTCRVCGLREPGIMEVDHIKPKSSHPELRYDLTNLVTLCPNDHARKSMMEQRNKIPWNKGRKGLQPNHNTDGFKLGHGWNKGIKEATNTGRTHFKPGNASWLAGTNIQTNTGKTHFQKGHIPWNKQT